MLVEKVLMWLYLTGNIFLLLLMKEQRVVREEGVIRGVKMDAWVMFFKAREVPISSLYTTISCGGDRSRGVTDNTFRISLERIRE
jgi:hypothetical protein